MPTPTSAGSCAQPGGQRRRPAERLERAVAEGELPEDFGCEAVATFYATVQQGMSIQARDGASRATLLAIADCALAAWEGLVLAKEDER